MATNWDTTFESLPTSLEDAGLGDDRIRTLKAAIRERFVKEHAFDVDEGGTQPRQGLHQAGSAVAFYQASAPTTRNGVALSAADNGILWVDSDTKAVYVWVTSAWVLIDDSAVNYRMQGKTVHLTSGSGNWTVPAGVYYIEVVCVGGGGGGGGAVGGSFVTDVGGGGGGGTQIAALLPTGMAVTPGSTKAYSVGAGGAGGTSAGSSAAATSGSSGGTTTFAGATSGAGGGGGLKPTYGSGTGGGGGAGASGGGASAGACGHASTVDASSLAYGGVGGGAGGIYADSVGSSAPGYGGGGHGGWAANLLGNGQAGGGGLIIIRY